MPENRIASSALFADGEDPAKLQVVSLPEIVHDGLMFCPPPGVIQARWTVRESCLALASAFLAFASAFWAVFLADTEVLASGPELAMAVPATAAMSVKMTTTNAGLAR